MTDLRVYKLSRKEEILYHAGLVLAGLAVSYLLYRNIFFAVVILPFSKKIKGFVTDSIISRRRKRYLAEFKDFLFMASTAIGAGRSMKDAIAESIPSCEISTAGARYSRAISKRHMSAWRRAERTM